MKKKICIVNFNVYCLFNPKSNAPMGGAELDMFTLSKGLESEYDVSIITGDWNQNDIERYGKIIVYKSLKLQSSNYLKGFLILWKQMKAVNADVYISSGAGTEVGIINLFCKLSGKKYIYRTAHDIDCNGKFVKENGIKGRIYEWGLKGADVVVTSVEKHKQLLGERYQALREKITQINLGILKTAEPVMINKEYILWVARCEKWKNPEAFLKLAETLPQYSFVMICPMQKHTRGMFNAIKKESARLKNVTFYDFIPFSRIQPFFDKALIFVNTSESEGFTYTLIQSGIGGTPVAYLNVNPDEVITKHGLGVYSGGREGELQEGIIKLLENKNHWDRCSAAIHGYVREHHGMDRLAQDWSSVIKRLL